MAAFNGWEAALLHSIGAPITQSNITFMRAWQRAEGGSAAYNPLNTTQGAPGATDYNSVHVRNYTSPQQGTAALAQTLTNGHYSRLLSMLRSGNASPQQMASDLPDLKTWGTGAGVLRVLGGKQVPLGTTGPTPPTPPGPLASSPGGSTGLEALRAMTASALLSQSAATAQGHLMDSSGLMALALARKQFQAAQTSYGPTPTTGVVTPGQAAPRPGAAGKLALPIDGQIGHLDPTFLSHLTAAAKARGAVRIIATSGERTPQHNAAIGGASHSNHLPDARGYGHAMDGYAVLANGSRVPLGQFLLPDAGKFSLRSGATFTWGGKPDVVHVDDGYNQG